MPAAPAAPTAPRPRRRPRPLGLFYWLLIALLYLPIAILFIFSINDGTSLSLPLRGFTFVEWDDASTPGIDASAYTVRDGAPPPKRGPR